MYHRRRRLQSGTHGGHRLFPHMSSPQAGIQRLLESDILRLIARRVSVWTLSARTLPTSIPPVPRMARGARTAANVWLHVLELIGIADHFDLLLRHVDAVAVHTGGLVIKMANKTACCQKLKHANRRICTSLTIFEFYLAPVKKMYPLTMLSSIAVCLVQPNCIERSSISCVLEEVKYLAPVKKMYYNVVTWRIFM